VIPAAATLGCLLFLKDMNRADLLFALETLLGGLLLFGVLRWTGRAAARQAP
jgi:hypothetical protein